MQFGSIGWSVGATLGYAQALKGKKRVIASIGDGSFQVTAQVRLAFFFPSISLLFIILHIFPCNFMFPFFFLCSSSMERPCHLTFSSPGVDVRIVSYNQGSERALLNDETYCLAWHMHRHTDRPITHIRMSGQVSHNVTF